MVGPEGRGFGWYVKEFGLYLRSNGGSGGWGNQKRHAVRRQGQTLRSILQVRKNMLPQNAPS